MHAAKANFLGRTLYHSDVPAAYNLAPVDANLPPQYVRLPKEWRTYETVNGKSVEVVYRVKQSMYGQHNASRAFGKYHAKWFTDRGAVQSTTEPGSFRYCGPDGEVDAAAFVDDCIWDFSNDTIGAEWMAAYTRDFGADFGVLTRFLNMDWEQDPEHGVLNVSQTGYIEEAYDRFVPEGHALRDADPPSTPATKDLTVVCSSEARACHPQATQELIQRFLSLVGVLMYLAHTTRGDLLLPTVKLAQSVRNPTELQYLLLLRVLVYGVPHARAEADVRAAVRLDGELSRGRRLGRRLLDGGVVRLAVWRDRHGRVEKDQVRHAVVDRGRAGRRVDGGDGRRLRAQPQRGPGHAVRRADAHLRRQHGRRRDRQRPV